MNFVCTVFEQGDEMLTVLSMEKTMVECNRPACPKLAQHCANMLALRWPNEQTHVGPT